MKIKYINEAYFKDVTLKNKKSSKEDVMQKISDIAKQQKIENRIKEIDSIKLSSAVSTLLSNIFDVYDGYSGQVFRRTQGLFINNLKNGEVLTLEPSLQLNRIPTIHTLGFYKKFKNLSKDIPAAPGDTSSRKPPFRLLLSSVLTNKYKTYIDIILSYICVPKFDIANMHIWDNACFENTGKNFVDLDLNLKETINGECGQYINMAGDLSCLKFVVDFLKQNREYTILDLADSINDYNLAKKLILTDDIMQNLKEDVDFLENYISMCLDVPVNITLEYYPRKNKKYPGKDPIPVKIL